MKTTSKNSITKKDLLTLQANILKSVRGVEKRLFKINEGTKTELLGTISDTKTELLGTISDTKTELLGTITQNKAELIETINDGVDSVLKGMDDMFKSERAYNLKTFATKDDLKTEVMWLKDDIKGLKSDLVGKTNLSDFRNLENKVNKHLTN